ncbi:MAG: hypothetical protein AAGD92_12820 [Pseudomonadota bacterium]
MDVNRDKKRDAVRALIQLALWEAVFLFAVVGWFLHSANVVHLVFGIAASTILFGPLFVRWFRDHGRYFSMKNGNHD